MGSLRGILLTIGRRSVARAPWFASVLITTLCAGASAAGQPASGSFDPPIKVVDNDRTAGFGAAIVGKADPVNIAGGAAGLALGFGNKPSPRMGLEAGVAAIKAWGTLDTGPGTTALKLNMTTVAATATAKYRAIPLADGGSVGLTLYGGVSFGFLQNGLTNDHGTAYRHFVSAGLSGGAVVQVVPHPQVEVMAFGGGRAFALGGYKESGDPSSQATGFTATTPEFGGNIVLHLPFSLDLSLGSLFNLFDSEDDKRSTAKLVVIGLSYGRDTGATPIVEGL